MEGSHHSIAAWARQIIADKWPGAEAGELVALKGDASTRRFWRVAIEAASSSAPPSAIVVDLGPDEVPLYARELKLYPRLQEPPWVDVHRFLSSLGAPVPTLYAKSVEKRLLMVEDVGALSLFDAARAHPAKAADLYRDAVTELMRLHIDGTAANDSNCVAFQIAYDERLFTWELRRFIEYGLRAVASKVDKAPLETEIVALAHELGNLPRVFSHRDFHGNNIFVQHNRLRIIDFQDALMAPVAQDLAVLLTTRDTCEVISPALENRLLDFYFTAAMRRGVANPGREEFQRSYDLCVLQHALKCIGAFSFLEQGGKTGYAQYIPFAISQARRMLGRLPHDFPVLRQLFEA